MHLNSLTDELHLETAFIPEVNGFDSYAYYSYYSTQKFWNGNYELKSTYNKFQRNAFRVFTEYSLTNQDAFQVKAGFSKVLESLNGNSCGLEDVELSWQHVLRETDSLAWATKFTFIIPTNDRKSSIRYGKTGFELSLLYTKYFTLKKNLLYVNLEGGYRMYPNPISDQARGFLSVAYQATPRLWVIGSSQLDYGLQKNNTRRVLNNICFNPYYRLLDGKILGLFQVSDNFSIIFGGSKQVWGQNAGAGKGFYGGGKVEF